MTFLISGLRTAISDSISVLHANAVIGTGSKHSLSELKKEIKQINQTKNN